MSLLIPNAWAQGAPDAATTGIFNIVLLLVFVVMLYFLLLRPQIKRAKQHKQMVDSLSRGDEIVSNGGVLGKVTEVDETFVALEIAKGLEIRLQKSSIASVVPKGTYKPVARERGS